jgi:hypothetical protein
MFWDADSDVGNWGDEMEPPPVVSTSIKLPIASINGAAGGAKNVSSTASGAKNISSTASGAAGGAKNISSTASGAAGGAKNISSIASGAAGGAKNISSIASGAAGGGEMDVLTAASLRYDPETALAGIFDPAGSLLAARSAVSDTHLSRIVARALREKDSQGIADSIRVIGARAVTELFSATIETENLGGLLTAENERRRSPGGTFYHLMKEVASKEQLKEIFLSRTKVHQKRTNAKKANLRGRRGGGGGGGGRGF